MGRKKYRYLKQNTGWIRQAVVLAPVAVLLVMLSQTAFAKTTVEEAAAVQIPQVCAAGEEMVVWYHGQKRQVPIVGETVGQLLTQLELDVAEGDVLSHGMDATVSRGMELRVDRVVVQQETYTATVPHDVTYCNDASIPEGFQEVLIEGRDGEVLRTAHVTYVNGVETSRKITEETQTISPVAEVVAVGTGSAAAAVDPNAMPVIGDGYIILPTGEVLTYTDTVTIRATAYTHTDAGCDMITATGSTVHVGTVAVDPRYIPYGTRMYIVSNDGSYIYGVSEAEDCGGAIKGDRMDLYFPTYEECMAFGWRVCTVYLLG
jgi:3D (Asp-Asp-Asp) domain-containing protein